jgi:hypothetical protein
MGNVFSASSRGLIAKLNTWTVPTTDWIVSNLVVGQRRGVDVSWARWRERYRDGSVPLPAGRSRKKHVAGSRRDLFDGFWTGGHDEYLYLHTSNTCEHNFPIPLSDLSLKVKPVPDGRYLFGRVTNTTLHVRLEPDEDPSLCLSLVNADDQWAGVLRLHNLSDSPANGTMLAMVAISKGSLLTKTI